jgi:hypothetical protein
VTGRPEDMTRRVSDPSTTPDGLSPHLAHEHTPERGGSRWGHHLMMLACCVPMLVVVGVLVVTGVAGTGAIVYALICTGMMAAMMLFMPGHKH